ncbi:HNH endonuclease [Macrococcus equipercicus]|uniref:HNH endonuclease n=1 Tax=Macrococcus equipercicus TaxID=69967 RepID=A0ABQ6R7J3_9STAP|nr:HNH endonuclease [Macrococcus equipercicus]KAA1039069.1 HNH endonuclease [Macrococcus equipercicus]
MFRKIAATEQEFIAMKAKHQEFFIEYQKFASTLTVKAGRAKDGKSEKAGSYTRYLIRIFLIADDISGTTINDPYSFYSYKLIEKLTKFEGFSEYNVKEARFPNAAIRCYLSFLTNLKMLYEQPIDDYINGLNENIKMNKEEIYSYKERNEKVEPLLKENKVNHNASMKYPRSIIEVNKAKELANWTCEYNSNHQTFISDYNNKPYIEAHHLIPMAVQDLYDYSIDFAHNITCLCPNCHRKIHYAKKEQRKEIVNTLFKKRSVFYKSYGININYHDLYTYYQII